MRKNIGCIPYDLPAWPWSGWKVLLELFNVLKIQSCLVVGGHVRPFQAFSVEVVVVLPGKVVKCTLVWNQVVCGQGQVVKVMVMAWSELIASGKLHREVPQILALVMPLTLNCSTSLGFPFSFHNTGWKSELTDMSSSSWGEQPNLILSPESPKKGFWSTEVYCNPSQWDVPSYLIWKHCSLFV